MPKIIIHGSPGAHHGANETKTVTHNGNEFVIPLGVETDVPQAVIDVLTDSRVLWTKVDAPTPSGMGHAEGTSEEAAPEAKAEEDTPTEGASEDAAPWEKKD